MTTPIFCTNCGNRLSPQVRFCESCGCPVALTSEPPSFSGPPLSPLPPPPPTFNVDEVPSYKRGVTPWIPFFLLFSSVVVLGGLWWLGAFNLPQWNQWLVKILPTNTSSPVVTSPTPTVAPVDANAVSLEDFVGVWMVMEGAPGEGEEAIFTMSLEGNVIVVEAEGDRVEFPTLNGRKLEGSAVEDGVTIPITVELNQNKDQIIVTVLPPNSELQVGVGQRVKGINDLDSPSNSRDNSLNMDENVLTERQALELLIAWPEIADWMQRVQQEAPQNQTLLEIVETTPQQYLIRAYESVNNPREPDHTATFGWYNVDRQTGEVTQSIP
ncbi:zinc ribbon domain-containing protein [Synechocystis sp. CACIAM 05]|uniref:zinc ribbon domain-containing protein n=1 Tax=Synechocystis sp. CACIAM 05 TaxID=1933929 RepID=UPI00138E56C8|nr:zinc ribbon domain-containing protein [Synechocystis sp. CACIAM 05]QHV00087.1 hypothetical protein BWK47_08070 [Synechocystis sp. CACIAM 05]